MTKETDVALEFGTSQHWDMFVIKGLCL